MFATKRPTRLTHNGAIVSFGATNDLDDDPTTAELIEDDVLPTKFKTAHVDIGMKEYGRVVSRTRMTRGMSMLPFDPVAGEKIACNAVSTMDRLAQNALYAAGGISFSKTPGTFGTAGGVPQAIAPVSLEADPDPPEDRSAVPHGQRRALRQRRLRCDHLARRGDRAAPESDAGGWRYFQINQQPSGGGGAIQRRQIGIYENFMFFVNNRLVGNKAIFLGADALAKVPPTSRASVPRRTPRSPR